MKKLILLSIIGCFLSIGATAQDNNMVVAVGDSPQRNLINPGYMPKSSYISLPFLGSLGVAVNTVNYGSFMTKGADGANIIDGKLLANKGEKPVLFGTNIDLINLGVRFTDKNLVTFALRTRASGGLDLPSDFLAFMYDNPAGVMRNFNPELRSGTVAWAEAAFGYTRVVNDKWSFGGKFKILNGVACLNTNKSQLQIDKSIDAYDISGDVDILVGGYDLNRKKYEYQNNFGVSFDFGGMFDSQEGWKVGFSVTDLGFINWGASSTRLTTHGMSPKYHYVGIGNITENKKIGKAFKEVFDDMLHTMNVDTVNQQFKTMTPTSLYLTGEYAFNNEKMHVVSLSALGRFPYSGRFEYNITAGYRYTIPNGRFSAIGTLSTRSVDPIALGVGLVANTKDFQFFVLTDYSLAGWGGVKYARSASFRWGFNFFFGKYKR